MSYKLIVFTAPSGAGKTTLVKHLLKSMPSTMSFSISATTREQRYGEVNGMDYYFISQKEFKDKISRTEFVEFQEVYNNQYYGTLKSEIERIWKLDKHVLFDMDVKGAMNIKKAYGDKVMVVFVKPPSKEILIQRLRDRKTEDEASMQKRIARITEELTYEGHCDKVVVNDDLEKAKAGAVALVKNFINL